MRGIYEFFGGRKQFNGYLYVGILLATTRWFEPDFWELAAALATALLGTSLAHAVEDGAKHLARPGAAVRDEAGSGACDAPGVARDSELL